MTKAGTNAHKREKNRTGPHLMKRTAICIAALVCTLGMTVTPIPAVHATETAEPAEDVIMESQITESAEAGDVINDTETEIEEETADTAGTEEAETEEVPDPQLKSAPSANNGKKGGAEQTISVPQKTYGVAFGAHRFRIYATAKTKLTFTSENEAVATVTADGVVKPKDPGKAKIVIRAEGTDAYNPAVKNVYVRVTKYTKAKRYFVQSNENYDGKPGDSSGKESKLSHYDYDKSKNWKSWGFIIRCTDPYVANHASKAALHIVKNNYFGYNTRFPTSQKNVDKRASIYKVIVSHIGKNPSYEDLKKIRSIKKHADTSCTPTIMAGYWLYYDMDTKISLKWRSPYSGKAYKYYCGATNVEYHQLETAIRTVNKEYRDKGMLEPFEIIYIPKSKQSSFFAKKNVRKNLKRGDILCSCPNYNRNGHTAIMQ